MQNSKVAAGILESLVNSLVVKFQQDDNRFPDQQFGLPGKGTTSCLRDTYAYWIQNIDYKVLNSNIVLPLKSLWNGKLKNPGEKNQSLRF